MRGHIPQMGERKNECRTLAEKSGGERPPGRLSHRWIDNIKMNLRGDGMGLYELD
jgi:hypothetical protein